MNKLFTQKHCERLGRNQTQALRDLCAKKPLSTDFTETLWPQCLRLLDAENTEYREAHSAGVQP